MGIQGIDIAYWENELAQAEESMREIVARREAIRRILSGAEELAKMAPLAAPVGQQRLEVPVPAAPIGPAAPQGFLRGREALRTVLEERGREMEQRQIYAVMKEKGWIEPGLKDAFSSVRVTLRRMAQKGEIRKVRDGVYAPLSQGGEPD